MAVENKCCRGDGPSSSLLSSSGPEGERLSIILCTSGFARFARFTHLARFARSITWV